MPDTPENRTPEAIMTGTTSPPPKPRWYQLTQDRLVIGLLVLECLLCLQWFACNHHKGWNLPIAVVSSGVASLLALWFIASVIVRWRSQFSWRTLPLFVTLMAILYGWFATELQQAKRQAEAVAALGKVGKRGAGVEWAYRVHRARPLPAEPAMLGPSFPADCGTPTAPEWLRILLEDDFFKSIVGVSFWPEAATDADLQLLQGLSQLQNVTLDGANVTDAGLENLRGLHNLQWLNLRSTHVTDVGLEHLRGLNQVKGLWLEGTQVTDAGLKHLQGWNELQFLNLRNTAITDGGLEHLKGLRQLQVLYLRRTQVYDAGVNQFQLWRQQQGLPKCRVDYDSGGVRNIYH